MSSFNLLEQTTGHYLVEGELTFFSLNKTTTKSFVFLNAKHEVSIDLSHVNSADSAGLALLVEWIKQSKRYGTKLVFKNIPEQLLTLAQLGGLDIKQHIVEYKAPKMTHPTEG